MSHPMVRNRRNTQVFDVYVGRPTFWGNPIVLEQERDRELVLEKYREFLGRHPEIVERAKKELRGKTLGCWCAPKPCHADVLAEIANQEE